MDFIEVTSTKVEEIQKHQNENKQLLDVSIEFSTLILNFSQLDDNKECSKIGTRTQR